MKHWAHFDIAGVMDKSANAVSYLIRECQVLREYNNDNKPLLADLKGNPVALWETKHGIPVNAEKRGKEEERGSLAVRSFVLSFVRLFFCVCAHTPPLPPQTGAFGNKLRAKVSKPCS